METCPVGGKPIESVWVYRHIHCSYKLYGGYLDDTQEGQRLEAQIVTKASYAGIWSYVC